MSVQNRLKALEDRAGLGSDLITVIVRRMVRPGAMEAASVIRNYGTPSSWSIERLEGEDLKAFRERAFAAAPRREGEIARFVEGSGGI